MRGRGSGLENPISSENPRRASYHEQRKQEIVYEHPWKLISATAFWTVGKF